MAKAAKGSSGERFEGGEIKAPYVRLCTYFYNRDNLLTEGRILHPIKRQTRAGQHVKSPHKGIVVAGVNQAIERTTAEALL